MGMAEEKQMMDRALKQAEIAVENQTKMAYAAEIAALAFAKLVNLIEKYLGENGK